MGNKKRIVKVTVPLIVTDNPMAVFSTRDGKWVQEVPVTTMIVKWMKGRHEAYFELEMNTMKIVGMKPTTEAAYYKTPGPENKDGSKDSTVQAEGKAADPELDR